MPAETPLDLWRAAVSVDPASPFVTAYDEASGGRVELSYATFDNWVAKTANLIVDGLGAEPGDRVVLALPVHWQSLVWLLACWSTDTTVVAAGAGELPEGRIVVTGPDGVEAALDTGADEVVGVSLHPLGAPMTGCPPPAVDFAEEARGHADQYTPVIPVDPDAVALDTGEPYAGSELVAAARVRGSDWELTSGDRVAIITSAPDPLTTLGSDLSRFLAPVSCATPVVLLPSTDTATLQSRLGMEHVTAIAGVPPGSPAPPGRIRPLS